MIISRRVYYFCKVLQKLCVCLKNYSRVLPEVLPLTGVRNWTLLSDGSEYSNRLSCPSCRQVPLPPWKSRELRIYHETPCYRSLSSSQLFTDIARRHYNSCLIDSYLLIRRRHFISFSIDFLSLSSKIKRERPLSSLDIFLIPQNSSIIPYHKSTVCKN